MRMQPNNSQTVFFSQLTDFIQFKQGNAKFGMNTGSAHVFMVTPAQTGIKPQKNFLSGENLTPFTQGVEIIQRHPYTLGEAIFIIGPWRKIGREQDALAVDIRKKGENMINFTR